MMKSSLLIVVLVALAALGAASAHASVWDRALSTPKDEATKDLYDAKMLEGDNLTLAATIQATSIANTVESINRAAAAYREAATLRPNESEPYFRIGNLLHQMYFGCEPQIVRLPTCEPQYATPKQQANTVEAWDEFEKRAPLDPRLGEILLKRAILNTKLINGTASDHAHLEAAARDYQAALDRNDGLLGTRGDEQLLGNLAETYMMLDRLDDAISTYLQAVAAGAARVSTMYGLAVALDRDGAGDQAIRRILEQGTVGFDDFQKDFTRGAVFFVPRGEEFYYFALSNEAFGNYGTALEFWKLYVASGVHPEFQPRAREHIEQLHKKQEKQIHAEPVSPELDDRTWLRRVR
jgi:tetratricopeptide (TPR) repeat protein